MPISGDLYVWGSRAKHVSAQPGVYTLHDKDKVLIYIGGSSNIKETLTHYLDTNFSENPCMQATQYYKREFTNKHEDREKELLEEYKMSHGELPKCNSPMSTPERLYQKEVSLEKGFHFYKDIGEPLYKVALSLKDLSDKIGEVPIVSIEFHQKRGDFANWIREVFGTIQLADAIGRVKETGEDLRKALIKLISNPETAWCPKCGAETGPVKTWTMAVKPSRTGERLQLTIGHYKCPQCNKVFRQVIAKEKI